MSKIFVNKDVLRKAKAIVVESKEKEDLRSTPPLPVVSLYYPRHGNGEYSHRYVRVAEMNDTHVKGFEIESEFDEEPGKPRTYLLNKVGGGRIVLLHLAKPAED